ncbi:hypothetical protein [Aurantiacibacter luteus]|nr:hypothetical protein [Aurantiacibacter luteus]
MNDGTRKEAGKVWTSPLVIDLDKSIEDAASGFGNIGDGGVFPDNFSS